MAGDTPHKALQQEGVYNVVARRAPRYGIVNIEGGRAAGLLYTVIFNAIKDLFMRIFSEMAQPTNIAVFCMFWLRTGPTIGV